MIVGIHHLNLGTFGMSLIVLIAVIEAAILGFFFMHLIAKKKTIHLVLLLTLIVFLSLLFWPTWDMTYSPRMPGDLMH